MTGIADRRALRGNHRRRVAEQLKERFLTDATSIHQLAVENRRRPSLIRRLLAEAGVSVHDDTCVGVDTVDQAARLAARYRSGVPVATIARDSGIDRRVVRGRLAEAGVGLRDRHPAPVERTDWIVDQYRAGTTLRALGTRLGCSHSTVRRLLLAAGIALRPAGNRSITPIR